MTTVVPGLIDFNSSLDGLGELETVLQDSGISNFNSSLDGLGADDDKKLLISLYKFQFQFGWFGSFNTKTSVLMRLRISIPVWMVWEFDDTLEKGQFF